MARVLLVDDDELVRTALHRILSRAGHDVTACENGRQALDQLDSCNPDVIVTDLVMPDIEGVEFIVQLKRRGATVPIIAISGGGRFNPDCYLTIAQKLGAARTLAKPIGAEAFLSTVDDVLTLAA